MANGQRKHQSVRIRPAYKPHHFPDTKKKVQRRMTIKWLTQRQIREAAKRNSVNARTTEQQAREMVAELCEIEEGLTDWEMNFVDDISRWQSTYTPRQIATIEKIYEKHIR